MKKATLLAQGYLATRRFAPERFACLPSSHATANQEWLNNPAKELLHHRLLDLFCAPILPAHPPCFAGLSPIDWLKLGLCEQEIATKVQISRHAFHVHVKAIYCRLSVTS